MILIWCILRPLQASNKHKNNVGNNKNYQSMVTHSSTLAWQIPWTEEPGRLQSMGSLGVGNDWATSLSLFTFMHWRSWQPTPVFLPGESEGRGSLVGCRIWGRTESDMTEATQQQQACKSPVLHIKYESILFIKWIIISKYTDTVITVAQKNKNWICLYIQP